MPKISSKSFIPRTIGWAPSLGVWAGVAIQLSPRKVGRSGETGASSYLSLLTVAYSVVVSLSTHDEPSPLFLRKLKQSLFSLPHREREESVRVERGVMRGVARAVFLRAMSRAVLPRGVSRAHSTRTLARVEFYIR